MSLLDALLYGVRDVLSALTPLNRKSRLNFGNNLTVTEDVVNDCLTVAAAASAVLPRRTPEDANTVLSWRFNENSPHPNSGNGGVLALTNGGSAVDGGTGISDGCVEFGDDGTGKLTSNATEIVPTAGAFTLIMWVYLRAYDTAGTIFAKAYNNAAWGAPFASLYIVEHDALGNWDFYANFAGVLTGPVTAGITIGKGRIPLNQWTMLAVTYDKTAAGGTVIQYTNGSQSLKTTAFGGVDVDFHTGVGGPYGMGVTPFSSVNPMHGAIDDIRVISGVMTAQQIGTYYRRFVNLSDT